MACSGLWVFSQGFQILLMAFTDFPFWRLQDRVFVDSGESDLQLAGVPRSLQRGVFNLHLCYLQVRGLVSIRVTGIV
jgi:hypothetical protein